MNHRYDFVYLFDIKDGNPNGDPDAGNLPRVDPETGHGLVTDVCLKRKIRNFVGLVKEETPPFEIYVKEKAVLNQQHDRAWEAVSPETKEKDRKKPPKELEKSEELTSWMCRNFYDIRCFGAVMTTGSNCGQVRGPVQFGIARSIDPVVTQEHTVTRCAVTTDREAKDQGGDNRTMGRKYTVPYGLFRVHGFINPFLASQTGFDENDLSLLWQALSNMFETDKSAARANMNPQRLIVFKHATKLGNAPSQKLLNAVTITPRNSDAVSRTFEDYEVAIPEASGLPDGVSVLTEVDLV